MENILDRLKELQETGREIICEDYFISYNPFYNAFILDIPIDRKNLCLHIKGEDEPYYWSCTDLFPISVRMTNSYQEVWDELEPYTRGVNITWLNVYNDNGTEFVYVEDEEGVKPILVEDITIEIY